MPRRPRHFKSDSIFHVGARGVDRQPIFLTAADREFFIAAMNDSLRDSNIRSVAFCLMPNHFHWAIATADTPFDRVIHRALTRHAVRFNLLHGRTGHLFESRHWSRLCADLGHVENAIAYIHLNPVRAKLVPAPEDWSWSSYRAWAGDGAGPDFDRVAEISGRSSDELRASHRARISSELAGGGRGVTAEELIDDVASMLCLPPSLLRAGTKGDEFTRAKRILIERARQERITLIDLAKALGCTPAALYMLRMRQT